MWKNDNNAVSPQRMTEALSDYEDAVREFSTSAAEFLKQVPLLTKAREAFERATTASTQLREILDRGDETLYRFMAQMQETISLPRANGVLADRRPGEETSRTIEEIGEKVDAARA